MPPAKTRAVRGGALACVVIVGSVVAAHAQAPTVPVRVDFHGMEGCSDGAELQRELDARDARIRTVGPGERAPLLVVTLTRGGRQLVHGRLVVEDVDGTSSRRDVDGDGCESVLGALALMAVIAVDPAAKPPSTNPTGTTSPTGATSPTGTTSATSPTSPTSAEDSGAPPEGASPTGHRGIGEGQGPHVGVTAGAGATTGISPAVAWTLPLSAEVAWGRETAASFLLRGGFLHADSGQDKATGGDVRFELDEGTLDLCASFPVTSALRLLPCAHTEAGSLAATGSNITPARSASRPWAGLGAAGAVRYRLFSPVFLELSLGVRFPLVRDRFFFEPDTTVFRPPLAAAFGAASLGVTFL